MTANTDVGCPSERALLRRTRMSTPSPLVFDIDEVEHLNSPISPKQRASWGEGCAIAFENQGHASPVTMKVSGLREESVQVRWTSPTHRSGWNEPRRIAEAGAITLAFFVVAAYTPYAIVEEAFQGEGVDYFLNDDTDDFNFFKARLEISGINSATKTNTIAGRVNEKIAQATRSAHYGLPAYIVVSEFSGPETRIVQSPA